MHFFSFGLNHHKADTSLREDFVLSEDALRSLYRSLKLSEGSEFVILSTCNRTECFLYGLESDVKTIQAGFGRVAGVAWPDDAAFIAKDEKAVMHVLEVAAGLDSMVLGDGQILNQVKDAYRIAVDEERVNAVLHRLMHTAFSTAKRVANETNVAGGSASIAGTAAAIAVQTLKKRSADVGENRTPNALVIGAGKMGRLVIEALEKASDMKLAVTNRSNDRTDQLLLDRPHVARVPWDERYGAMAASDIVIVASAAEQYVVAVDELRPHPRSLFEVLIIDIAVPRNVDPGIDALPGYRVYDMDVLKHLIDDVLDQRKDEAPRARGICEEMLADFVSWFFHHQAMQPAIRAILDTFDSIRLQEIERHQARFNEVDFAQLERITRSIMQKVLAVPVVRLKNVGPEHIDYVNGIKLLQTLFARTGCEDPVSSYLDFSEDMLSVLAEPDRINLSTLAACPFYEMKGSDSVEKLTSSLHGDASRALRLGTRASALALWQADHVQRRLEAAGYRLVQERITTRGDQILDRPLAQIEGKSLFTKELDIALIEGRIDLAVHSLKDLPSRLPEGLALAAITRREMPFDAFVAHPSYSGALDDLPEGAVIATSSLRRSAQLKAWRPDLEIVPVRGNVDTRLAKLDAGSWHGMVLAAAGLIRLGLRDRIHTMFDPEIMLPAVGQGALGIICASVNTYVYRLLKEHLHDAETAACVRSERAFLATLEGSCQVPVGAFAQRNVEGDIVLDGLIASLDGREVVRGREKVDVDAPETAGIALARRLLVQGAAEILQLVRMS